MAKPHCTARHWGRIYFFAFFAFFATFLTAFLATFFLATFFAIVDFPPFCLTLNGGQVILEVVHWKHCPVFLVRLNCF